MTEVKFAFDLGQIVWVVESNEKAEIKRAMIVLGMGENVYILKPLDGKVEVEVLESDLKAE